MNVLADSDIPYLKELFGNQVTLTQIPGRQITPQHAQHSDALLVRSVTSVNETLLKNSPVKFVGTATSGIDHLDTVWLTQQNIHWKAAPGCNAAGVAEYVLACIASLKQQGLLNNTLQRAGVIGVGQVGQRISHLLKKLNFTVIEHDPPRAEQGKNFYSTPLSEFKDLDLICLHTPLTTSGNHPTLHMLDKNFLQQQKPGCVLLNAGRGEVINTLDLKRYGKHLHWCFDVWPNEPAIDFELVSSALIATPHIAGYTHESKLRGTLMIYATLCQFFKIPLSDAYYVKPLESPFYFNKEKFSAWNEFVLNCFNPMQLTQTFKNLLQQNENSIPQNFDKLRMQILRYEYGYEKLVIKN